ELLKCNLIKTIEFNFKMLPFKQAKKLPILFYGKTDFRSLKGEVKIKGPVYTGKIKVGPKDIYVDTSIHDNIWTINGTVVFDGPIRFFRGSYILVAKNALLEINSKSEESFITKIGSNTKILCFEHIMIGYACRITWECQIYDTSFHYIEYTDSCKDISSLSSPVCIGNNTWIGNRSTVSKGAIIPDNTIVASNSLVNKDFSQIEPYTMLAGCPAVVKATGLRRIFDRKAEKEMDRKFNYSRTGL
ncbi:MAG: acyltransferase, partial [Bacteroidales bacterium]|nr:acyltransferase [Bacteroidales bacterium]